MDFEKRRKIINSTFLKYTNIYISFLTNFFDKGCDFATFEINVHQETYLCNYAAHTLRKRCPVGIS